MTQYTKPGPYTKPRTYNGAEIVPAVSSPAQQTPVRLRWLQAAPHQLPARVPWLSVRPQQQPVRARWTAPDGHAQPLRLVWDYPAPHAVIVRVRWQDTANRRQAPARARWAYPAPHQRATRTPWADCAVQAQQPVRWHWRYPQPRQQTWRTPWRDYPAKAQVAYRLVWGYPKPHQRDTRLRWGPSGSHNFSVTIPWTQEPPGPGEGGTITVPIQDTYYMQPDISVVRTSDSADIHVTQVELSTDLDSWAWSGTLTVPAIAPDGTAQLPLVDPADAGGPTEVTVTINGHVWQLVVTGYTDNRKFGSRTLSLQVRSPSILLAAPWATARTYREASDRDMSQLAQQEVTAVGWTVDWNAVDWLVPAGIWTYTDQTPIGAILALAGSINARVHTDAASKTLQVASRYVVSPWDWSGSTPYAQIPGAIITGNSGDWQGGQDPNGIYVYAANYAAGAFVKVTGSDGTPTLQQVIDPLLVDSVPLRERGRIEIASGGRVKNEQRTIPLFADPDPPGLIPLGVLIEVVDPDATWRGQVQGISIRAARAGAGGVRQTLTIERQYR